MTRLVEIFMGTRVKTVFALFVLLFLNLSISRVSGDCDPALPYWKLGGTNCRIFPYYYTVVITSSANSNCQCNEDYHNYNLQGSATEYWRGWGCNPCYQCIYMCEEPEFSCDGTSSGCYAPYSEGGCKDTHPRFYCNPCLSQYSETDCGQTGHWNGKVFNRTCDSTTDIGHNGYEGTAHSHGDLTITAIFEKPSDPNCYTKPEVHTDKYDSEVLVKAKDGDICCETNGSQTIHIWCSGASHIKNVQYTEDDGQLYTVYVQYSSDVDQCDMNNHSGPSVKVTYSPRDGEIDYQEGLEEEVTVSCTFYDNAGNECGSASESIKFVLDCPPLPDKG